MPAASLVGRHVDQDDAVGRRPELFAGDYAPEPLRLLFAVSVGGRKPVIADVAVGFVLAAVEYDEEDGTAAERIVTFAGRRGEVVEPVPGELAASVVVAARHDERNARRGEQLRRRCEESFEKRLLRFDRIQQVAVQAYEVGLLARCVPDKQPEDGIAAVDVVHHPEFQLVPVRAGRCDGIGRVFEYVAAVALAQYDPFVAFVAEHGLLHDAVAVGFARFESADAHPVQFAQTPPSEVRVVVFGAFDGIEVRSVIGGRFDPRRRVRRCRPDYGESVLGHVLEVGTSGDACRRL